MYQQKEYDFENTELEVMSTSSQNKIFQLLSKTQIMVISYFIVRKTPNNENETQTPRYHQFLRIRIIQ